MPRRIKAMIVGCGVAIVAVLILGACSNKFQEPFRDAPIAHRDNSAATVLEMPDGFSNVATKCDGTNRIYVVYHHNSAYGSVAVAPNDPRCGGGR